MYCVSSNACTECISCVPASSEEQMHFILMKGASYVRTPELTYIFTTRCNVQDTIKNTRFSVRGQRSEVTWLGHYPSCPTPSYPPGPPLHRLPGQYLHWSPCSGVYLVVDHVLEPLVVGGANEDLRVQLTPCEPVVQNLGEGQGREGGRGRRGGERRKRCVDATI